MTLRPVKARALHTSKQAWWASRVAAAELNAGVWFPPFGSVGMAAGQDTRQVKPLCKEGRHTETRVDGR